VRSAPSYNPVGLVHSSDISVETRTIAYPWAIPSNPTFLVDCRSTPTLASDSIPVAGGPPSPNRPLFRTWRATAGVVCLLLSSRRMPLRPDARTSVTTRPFDSPFAGCVVVLLTALLGPAQPLAQEAVLTPHVRPESRDARRFVEEAMEKSATIRELIDRLAESDVVAYVRFRALGEIGVDGRLRFLAATTAQRYVVIDLACARPRVDEIAIFGHELHHALEIAAAPSIVNSPTLAEYYARAGIETGGIAGVRMFETRAARATAEIVRKEVFAAPERRTYGQ
jgi:hypothetical protein